MKATAEPRLVRDYRVGLVLGRPALTSHQGAALEAMVADWLRLARRFELVVPTWDAGGVDCHGDLLRSLDGRDGLVTVARWPAMPLDSVEQVLRCLDGVDELVGFPARGRSRQRPDRVWEAFGLVPSMRGRGRLWPASMRMVLP